MSRTWRSVMREALLAALFILLGFATGRVAHHMWRVILPKTRKKK